MPTAFLIDRDGTIRHIMSGVNVHGISVHAFKRPSDEELDARIAGGIPMGQGEIARLADIGLGDDARAAFHSFPFRIRYALQHSFHRLNKRLFFRMYLR